MQYSLKKGVEKGATSGLVVLLSIVTFAGLADVAIWDFIEQQVEPLFGSVTFGALITMAINYFKVKNA